MRSRSFLPKAGMHPLEVQRRLRKVRKMVAVLVEAGVTVASQARGVDWDIVAQLGGYAIVSRTTRAWVLRELRRIESPVTASAIVDPEWHTDPRTRPDLGGIHEAVR